MPRYADPTLCPDCHYTLPVDPVRCPQCALPLRGPDAITLFQTLQSADVVLARLRASANTAPATAAVAGAGPAGPRPEWAPEPFPAPAQAPAGPRARRGLSAASVPKILLGLGALCLLVAAVTFLAVAWSWLGVGGRTAVLVALTLIAGGVGTWLGRRGLRIGAESLTVVSLGLLVLDVIGADNADWMGNLDPAGLSCIIGGTLLAASLALLIPSARLVAPQAAASLGLFVAAVGAAGLGEHDRIVATLAVLAFAALARAGQLLAVRVLPWVAAAGGATWWSFLALSGLSEAMDHDSVSGLWLDGHGWALTTAAALLLLPIAFARSHPRLVVAWAAASATLATVAIALPGLDEGVSAMTVTCLVVLVSWSAVCVVTPVRWAPVPRAPLALASLPVLAVSVALVGDATVRVLDLGEPFTRGFGVRLVSSTTLAHPALLAAGLAGLVLAAAVLLPASHAVAARVARPGAAAVVLLVAAATLGLIPAPLWTAVGCLVAAGATLLGAALRRTDRTGTVWAASGAAILLAATISALPTASLTAAVLAVLVGALGLVEVTTRFPQARLVSGSLLPLAAAGLIWSLSEVLAVDDVYRGAPVLLVVGLLAILRPRLAMEASAAAAGTVAAVAAVAAVAGASDQATSTSIHLTLAGALVSASALVTPSRRPLGWLGGLLLAAATWVRLADLGVHAPEAYTLPTAVALIVVGLRRLYVDPEASTRLALVPGLALATTPSLLWVLADGLVSLRAVLLGLACLALVLAGARLRWSAPVSVGSTVGAVLVLAELAPYVLVTPQWLLIGAAGTLLTVVGVTWESRLRDVRTGMAYLGRLR